MEALILACLIIIIMLLAADKFRVVKKNKPIPQKEQQKSSQHDIIGPTRSVRYIQTAYNSVNTSDAKTTTDEEKSDMEDVTGETGDPEGKPAIEEEPDSHPYWEEEEAQWPSKYTTEDDSFATGVTFEELVDVNRLLARESLDQQQQKQVVQTLTKVQGTEMFNLVQNSIGGASQRIADLLDAYVHANQQPASPDKQPRDAGDFDIGAFV